MTACLFCRGHLVSNMQRNTLNSHLPIGQGETLPTAPSVSSCSYLGAGVSVHSWLPTCKQVSLSLHTGESTWAQEPPQNHQPLACQTLIAHRSSASE